MDYIKDKGVWKEVDTTYIKGSEYQVKRVFTSSNPNGAFSKTGDAYNMPWSWQINVPTDYTAIAGDYLRIRIILDDMTKGKMKRLTIDTHFSIIGHKTLVYTQPNMPKTVWLVRELIPGKTIKGKVTIYATAEGTGQMTISASASDVQIVRKISNTAKWLESDSQYIKVGGHWSHVKKLSDTKLDYDMTYAEDEKGTYLVNKIEPSTHKAYMRSGAYLKGAPRDMSKLNPKVKSYLFFDINTNLYLMARTTQQSSQDIVLDFTNSKSHGAVNGKVGKKGIELLAGFRFPLPQELKKGILYDCEIVAFTSMTTKPSYTFGTLVGLNLRYKNGTYDANSTMCRFDTGAVANVEKTKLSAVGKYFAGVKQNKTGTMWYGLPPMNVFQPNQHIVSITFKEATITGSTILYLREPLSSFIQFDKEITYDDMNKLNKSRYTIADFWDGSNLGLSFSKSNVLSFFTLTDGASGFLMDERNTLGQNIVQKSDFEDITKWRIVKNGKFGEVNKVPTGIQIKSTGGNYMQGINVAFKVSIPLNVASIIELKFTEGGPRVSCFVGKSKTQLRSSPITILFFNDTGKTDVDILVTADLRAKIILENLSVRNASEVGERLYKPDTGSTIVRSSLGAQTFLLKETPHGTYTGLAKAGTIEGGSDGRYIQLPLVDTTKQKHLVTKCLKEIKGDITQVVDTPCKP